MLTRLATAADTEAFGRRIGQRLRAGDLVLLSGDLGAGKTTLTKGIAVGMGIAGRITSPTFVIARVHRPAGAADRPAAPAASAALTGPTGSGVSAGSEDSAESAASASVPVASGPSLVHVDAYRLGGRLEVDDLDLDTDLSRAAVVVEWGTGVAEQMADAYLHVELVRLADDSREVTLTAVGGDWPDRLRDLVDADIAAIN